MNLHISRSSGNRWERAADAMASGADLAEACRLAPLSPQEEARLLPRWSGAWVDLLDGLDGAAVLVADHSPGRAALRLAEVARTVGFVEVAPDRAAFRRCLLRDRPAGLLLGSADELLARTDWDVVVMDGVIPAGYEGFPSAGRLVIIADNLLSPVRILDLLRSRPTGAPGRLSLGRVCGQVERSGFRVRQRIGLLRSAAEPVTAFDLEAPAVADAVLRSAAAQVSDSRAVALQALRPWAGTRVPEALVPAWMVVASPPGPDGATLGAGPTGRIGSADSEEVKIVRGNPPRELEKIYSTPTQADCEWMALELLARCAVDVAPRPLSRLGPTRSRQSWIPGEPLQPHRLRVDEIRRWIAAAARALGQVQRATRSADGSVLVHGDLWLGNLLVDRSSVRGIVDWTEAHRGDADEDVAHLVGTAVQLDRGRALDKVELMRLARYERSAPPRKR